MAKGFVLSHIYDFSIVNIKVITSLNRKLIHVDLESEKDIYYKNVFWPFRLPYNKGRGKLR